MNNAMPKLSANQSVMVGAFISNNFIIRNTAIDLEVAEQNVSKMLKVVSKRLPSDFFTKNRKYTHLGMSINGVNVEYKALSNQYVDIFNKYIAISKLSNI